MSFIAVAVITRIEVIDNIGERTKEGTTEQTHERESRSLFGRRNGTVRSLPDGRGGDPFRSRPWPCMHFRSHSHSRSPSTAAATTTIKCLYISYDAPHGS